MTQEKNEYDVERVADEMLEYDAMEIGQTALTEGVDAVPPWARKIDQQLIEAYQQYYVDDKYEHAGQNDASSLTQDGYVAVDAVAGAEGGEALLSDLEALGLQNGAAYRNSVGGLLPLEAIPAAVATDTLVSIRTPAAQTNVGAAEAQSDEALQADVVRSNFGVDGTGVKIGILSDSFDTSVTASTDAAADIATGDLPGAGNPLGNTTPVDIVDDTSTGVPPGTSIDEGRAMAQIIHDIAPGAELAFHTAFPSKANFASGIIDLADAGADIIVDDVIYVTSPYYQDGVVSQAVDEVAARGVAYYTAATNENARAYESEYREVAITGTLPGNFHDFDPDPANVDERLLYTIPADGSLFLSIQWDEPFASAGGAGSASAFSAFLVEAGTDNVLAFGLPDIADDPAIFFNYNNPSTTDAQDVEVLIRRESGPAPNIVKVGEFQNPGAVRLQQEYVEITPNILGQPGAEGAQAVGASFYQDTPEFGQEPPLIEPFSSLGPKTILFDEDGNRLAEPEIRQAPDIVAADGVDTTFFGTDVDGNGFPNFFGTSAAAPAAAAVAGLLKEAFPDATVEEINTALQETAIDMDAPGVDDLTGFGLIQADAAYAALSEDKKPPKKKRPDDGKHAKKDDKCDDGHERDDQKRQHDDHDDGIYLTRETEAGYGHDEHYADSEYDGSDNGEPMPETWSHDWVAYDHHDYGIA